MSIATPEFVHCWHSYEHVTEPCDECTSELLEAQQCCACDEDDKARLFLCVPFDPVNLCERCSEEWAGGYAEPESVRTQPVLARRGPFRLLLACPKCAAEALKAQRERQTP